MPGFRYLRSGEVPFWFLFFLLALVAVGIGIQHARRPSKTKPQATVSRPPAETDGAAERRARELTERKEKEAREARERERRAALEREARQEAAAELEGFRDWKSKGGSTLNARLEGFGEEWVRLVTPHGEVQVVKWDRLSEKDQDLIGKAGLERDRETDTAVRDKMAARAAADRRTQRRPAGPTYPNMVRIPDPSPGIRWHGPYDYATASEYKRRKEYIYGAQIDALQEAVSGHGQVGIGQLRGYTLQIDDYGRWGVGESVSGRTEIWR